MKQLIKRVVVTALVLIAPYAFAEAKDISQEAFDKLKEKKPDTVILDVRTPEEYSEGYIEGAKNITHTDIEKILSSVNKDDTIVLYCRSGRRAGLVADALTEKGHKNVYLLEGDMKEWIAKGRPVVKPK